MLPSRYPSFQNQQAILQKKIIMLRVSQINWKDALQFNLNKPFQVLPAATCIKWTSWFTKTRFWFLFSLVKAGVLPDSRWPTYPLNQPQRDQILDVWIWLFDKDCVFQIVSFFPGLQVALQSFMANMKGKNNLGEDSRGSRSIMSPSGIFHRLLKPFQ